MNFLHMYFDVVLKGGHILRSETVANVVESAGEALEFVWSAFTTSQRSNL